MDTSKDRALPERVRRARMLAGLSSGVAILAGAYFVWLDGWYKWAPGESGLIEVLISHVIGGLIVLIGATLACFSLSAAPRYDGVIALLLQVVVVAGVFLYFAAR